jgi:hypothetical protein
MIGGVSAIGRGRFRTGRSWRYNTRSLGNYGMVGVEGRSCRSMARRLRDEGPLAPEKQPGLIGTREVIRRDGRC